MAAAVLFLTWPDAEPSPEAERARVRLADGGWASLFRGSGVEVWAQGGLRAPNVAELRPGLIVIGECRRQGSLQQVDGDGLGLSVAPVVARARRLVDEAWGRYLALLRAEEGGWRVLRDPSGAIDALTWRRGRLGFVASDVAPVPAGLLPADLALDWDVITDLLRRPGGSTARSPLHAVETVFPGALHAVGGGEAPVLLWRPVRLAQVVHEDDPKDLRTAVDLSVGAAVSGADRGLLEVSGGFDSAVVATTATGLTKGQRWKALHLHNDRPESDERRWAEIVSSQTGLELLTAGLEIPTLTATDFDELVHGARPAINAIDVSRDRRTVEAAEATGAERLVTGKGGDAVFFQHPTAEILSDLVASRGWRGWMDPLATRLARRLRRCVWSVGLEALQALRRKADAEPLSPLLGPRAWAVPAAAAHPWLEGIEGLSPARRYQLYGLVVTQIARGVTRYGRLLEVHHPLLSQPVMEAALSIPVWRLARDGRERGLARDLFADRVPPEIVTRRSKGEMSTHFARTVAANLAFLRPYLLDGCLCDAGVLDRAALEAALAPEALIQSSESVLILSAAAVEAFVRHWQARAPDHPRNARSQP